jgi:hypothetical protein
MSKKIALAVLAAAAVVGTAGSAFATIRASHSSMIKACARRGTGQLRLAQRCKSNERAVTWAQHATVGSQAYAYVTANKAIAPNASRNVTEMTRSADGDYYCFDLPFTPVNVVASAGLGGSYIVGDVVGANTLPKDRAATLCGTAAVDAVVYFPSGESGFYAAFN